jgi:hypothetical protein
LILGEDQKHGKDNCFSEEECDADTEKVKVQVDHKELEPDYVEGDTDDTCDSIYIVFSKAIQEAPLSLCKTRYKKSWKTDLNVLLSICTTKLILTSPDKNGFSI